LELGTNRNKSHSAHKNRPLIALTTSKVEEIRSFKKDPNYYSNSSISFYDSGLTNKAPAIVQRVSVDELISSDDGASFTNWSLLIKSADHFFKLIGPRALNCARWEIYHVNMSRSWFAFPQIWIIKMKSDEKAFR